MRSADHDRGDLPDGSDPSRGHRAGRRLCDHYARPGHDRPVPVPGESEDTAEEIAARTVNKERTQAGEARTSSRLSRTDMSPSRRGGLRSHTGAGGRTRDELYEEAKQKNVKGRSSMTKAQLERAVGR
jgi:hypothetical protein